MTFWLDDFFKSQKLDLDDGLAFRLIGLTQFLKLHECYAYFL